MSAGSEVDPHCDAKLGDKIDSKDSSYDLIPFIEGIHSLETRDKVRLSGVELKGKVHDIP